MPRITRDMVLPPPEWQRTHRQPYPCTTVDCAGTLESVPGAVFHADRVDGGVHWRIPFHCAVCDAREESVGFWRATGKSAAAYRRVDAFIRDPADAADVATIRAANPGKAAVIKRGRA